MNEAVRPGLDVTYQVDDKAAHLAWEPDLGLAEPSTVASPVYILADRKAVRGGGGYWVWR